MIVVEVESVDFHSIIIENVPYVITTLTKFIAERKVRKYQVISEEKYTRQNKSSCIMFSKRICNKQTRITYKVTVVEDAIRSTRRKEMKAKH
jgi:hypothetical protein